MHHVGLGVIPPGSTSPPSRRPPTSLSERYSLRVPKRVLREDLERTRSLSEPAGEAAVVGKSVTLSRQAGHTAARREPRRGGGEEDGEREGGRKRERVKRGRFSEPRKSSTLPKDEYCLIEKRRAESSNQHVHIVQDNVNKRTSERIITNANKELPLREAKPLKSLDFNQLQRSKSQRHGERRSPKTQFNNLRISNSLGDLKSSPRLLARSPSARLSQPASLQSSLISSSWRQSRSSWRRPQNNSEKIELASSETASAIPTGWRFLLLKALFFAELLLRLG